MTDTSFADRFSRSMQLELLRLMAESYPGFPSKERVIEVADRFDDMVDVSANLVYLYQHGLIEKPYRAANTDDGPVLRFMLNELTITEKGIDLVLDDGGLTAILGVQTIKIHTDTMRNLEEIILSSNIPEAEKKGLLAKLRELPSSAITHLTNELVVKAALALPGALPLIQTYLQSILPK
ncbi:hypothetical protein [Morganella morganii]|uniref:hypothetical protein n=1 Tax=Morganella morganii TaxID=582 RepID=UPI002368A9BB|nr:hypothetical protein [Morganella morganii]